MKKLLVLLYLFPALVFGQSQPGKKTSQLNLYSGAKTGVYVPIVKGSTNWQVEASFFAADKIDSTSIGYGPSSDTLWHFKNGEKKYYKLFRASTTSGTTTAPTAPTPAVGDNSTRILTTAGLIAERAATATYTGKTFNGSNNTFLNIPQSAVTNVAADIAARVTLQQLRDSLSRVDTTRKLVFVNLGVGGYGLIEAASSDTVRVLSLIGSPSVTITRVGNNLQFTATASGTAFDFAADHSFTGTNTYTGTTNFNGDVIFNGHTSTTGYLFAWKNSSGNIDGGVTTSGQLTLGGLPDLADNAAALAAGLGLNRIYRTGDLLKIVH